jgi:hypothetical protein
MNENARLLSPQQTIEFLHARGVQVSVTTLSTWRNRDPERLPFRRIFGRIYYPVEVLEALVEGKAAAAAR